MAPGQPRWPDSPGPGTSGSESRTPAGNSRKPANHQTLTRRPHGVSLFAAQRRQLGVAVLGTALNLRYEHLMLALIGRHAVPPAIHDVILGSLGGALEVAARIPGPAGAALADAARRSFVSGMDLGLLIANATSPVRSSRCTGSSSSRPVMRMSLTSRGDGATRCREDPACPACLLIRTSAPRPRASQKLRPATSSMTGPP